MAVPAKRLERATRVALTKEKLLRLVRFPAIRRAISGGLARQTPLSVDIPKGGRFIRFRLAHPGKFHPALFATMPLGGRGTLGVIGTKLSTIYKRKELASFIRRLGARLKGPGRKGMIYQLRAAGIIGPSTLQSVLVPRSRVEQVVARFAASPRLRKVVGNPILATLGFNPRLSWIRKRDGRIMTRRVAGETTIWPRRHGGALSLRAEGFPRVGGVSESVSHSRARHVKVADVKRNARGRQMMPRRVPKGRANEIAAALRRRGYTALTYAAYPGKVWSTAPKALVKAVARKNGPVLPTAAFNRRKSIRRSRRNPLTETEVKRVLGCADQHFAAALRSAQAGRTQDALRQAAMAIAHANDAIAFADREKWQLHAKVACHKYSQLVRALRATGSQKRAAIRGRVSANPVLPYSAFNPRKKCPPGMMRTRGGRCVPRRTRRNADPFPMLNRGKRRARRNDGTQVISIPFRDGQKIRPAQMRAWLKSLPEGEVKRNIVRRFDQGLKQYKSFHLGSEPKSFTYRAVQMGSAGKQITDVDVVVSEGKEWAATYQVPRHSRKYHGGGSDGRYIHAHGESDMDVDIKRVASKRLLPERFHTADGRFIGVVPTKNVRIGEWYTG